MDRVGLVGKTDGKAPSESTVARHVVASLAGSSWSAVPLSTWHRGLGEQLGCIARERSGPGSWHAWSNWIRLGAAAAGDTLCHADLCEDNRLLTAKGVTLVDWPYAVTGAAWMDALLFLPSAAATSAIEPEKCGRHSGRRTARTRTRYSPRRPENSSTGRCSRGELAASRNERFRCHRHSRGCSPTRPSAPAAFPSSPRSQGHRPRQVFPARASACRGIWST